MATPPAERKALLFSAGGVRLALRLAQLREIASAEPGAGQARVRGGPLPLLPVAVSLGLAPGTGAFALVIESDPPVALQADALHGIVDLADAEVFQLPARTALPRPPPFQGAVVARGEVSLELDTGGVGWEPLQPAEEVLRLAESPGRPSEPEMLFSRGGRTFAVPVSLLVHVFEEVRLWPVPLASPSHRGLLYHGRALHPVFDVVAPGPRPPVEERKVLLLDAGGTAVGLLADRVLGVGEGKAGGRVERLAWDSLFPS